MKINGASILKSLLIITILFIVFSFGAYFLKRYLYNDTKTSLSIKSNDSLIVQLDNNLSLSDNLAIENNKDSISRDIFKNIEFDVINKHKNSVNYELYITKEENDHEIDGKYIKFYLTKGNGDLINGYSSDNVPVYATLNVIDNLPGSRILYRGTINGNSTDKFNFKTWISDSYKNFDDYERFVYKINIRVI